LPKNVDVFAQQTGSRKASSRKKTAATTTTIIITIVTIYLKALAINETTLRTQEF